MNLKLLAKYFITPLVLSLNTYPQVYSKEQSIVQDYISQSTTLEKKKITPDYILGPGDQISIKFVGIENYSDIYIVDNQGFIDLPELNLQKVENYTLSELKKILLEKYNEFIYDPQLKINLYKERPLKVTLRGEVKTSGLFVFVPKSITQEKQQNNASLKGSKTQDYKPNNINSFTMRPTLFDLIQKADGLTTNADLSRIIVVRNNSLSGGGGKLKTEINLFNLIDKGDQDMNIELRDGDDILVSRSEDILFDQLSALNNSNLTPNQISVFINGNVRKSGQKILPQGISLFEAIAASGERSLSGNIEFIRLSKRGKTKKRIIAFNDKSIKGSTGNPILLSGDIIYVRKNILGQTTSAINQISSPIIRSYGLYNILN